MMTGTKKRFTGAIVLVVAMMITLILGSMPAFAGSEENEATEVDVSQYALKQVPADEVEQFADAFDSSDWSTGYLSDFVALSSEDEAEALGIANGLNNVTEKNATIIYNYETYSDANHSIGYKFKTDGDAGKSNGYTGTMIKNAADSTTFYYPIMASESTGVDTDSEDTDSEDTDSEDTDVQENPAAATGEDNQETPAAANGNEYTLTRTVASSDTPYTWTIPTAIDWTAVGADDENDNAGLYKGSVEFKIAPTSGEAFIILENGKSLQMTVSSGNGWKLKGTNNNELAYTATKDGATTAIANGETIFDVASGSDDASGQTVKVNFATTDAAKIADTYTDTLTFTSSIVDTPAAEQTSQTSEEPSSTASENQSTPE